ncbi:hypothetical protein LPJ72_002266 [Coemansia sp. Benny D160-2]|nr:hypothetical protein LPJ72_002266 [Coemansia sp. Benny D160-2]
MINRVVASMSSNTALLQRVLPSRSATSLLSASSKANAARAISMAGQQRKWWHAKVDVKATSSVESAEEHIDPIGFHNYLKNCRDRGELKEFLAEESEIIATDSFNDPSSQSLSAASVSVGETMGRSGGAGASGSARIDSKDLNEQFKKQIRDLLNPSYGM